jgi:fructan beta-fructosidase
MAQTTFQEPFRPQFHFTPERNWMNDPNGLVYHDGEYHLFYQYNPFGDKWGHMSWGHAVSSDFVHWKHLPLALSEQGEVMIFSGSAVVDSSNSSGFGKDDQPPMVAIYTGHREETKHAKRVEDQRLAYSNDGGRTWAHYSGNPVIDIGSPEFRDPKVFWHEPTNQWIMVVVLSKEKKVRLYASHDLKKWTQLSEFGPAGAWRDPIIWECPDLFPLEVEREPSATKWVLIVNINPGGPAGGSGSQYFVGEFDGTRFTPDDAEGTLWVDYGSDFYAAVTWSNVPESDGRRILLGWMSNWDYTQHIPTSPWRSAMTVPRSLRLERTSKGLRLVQEPYLFFRNRKRFSTFRGETDRTGIGGREDLVRQSGPAILCKEDRPYYFAKMKKPCQTERNENRQCCLRSIGSGSERIKPKDWHSLQGSHPL